MSRTNPDPRNLETYIGKQSTLPKVDKIDLYGSSMNCKMNTFVFSKPGEQPTATHIVKYQVSQHADNMLIDDYIGQVLQTIDIQKLFSEYVDSFTIPIIQVSTPYTNRKQQVQIKHDHIFPFIETYSSGPCKITTKRIKDVPNNELRKYAVPLEGHRSVPRDQTQTDIIAPVHIQLKLENYDELCKYPSLDFAKHPRFLTELNKFFDKLANLGRQFNYIHNDAHLGNIMICKASFKMRFIDFGRNYFDTGLVSDPTLSCKIPLIFECAHKRVQHRV